MQKTTPAKGRCGMSAATLVGKSLEESQIATLDQPEVRESVRLNATIVTANGIARCQVTDISETACRLQLFKPLTMHQYLALEIECGETGGVHIPLAQVHWTNDLMAGVEFVYLAHPTVRKRDARNKPFSSTLCYR
jgi:hypothetical protein